MEEINDFVFLRAIHRTDSKDIDPQITHAPRPFMLRVPSARQTERTYFVFLRAVHRTDSKDMDPRITHASSSLSETVRIQSAGCETKRII